MFARAFVFLVFMSASFSSLSQVGHPAKGSWSGSIGVNAVESTRLRLLIQEERGLLSTTVNPGRKAVGAFATELDAPNWNLTIKAEMPEGELVMIGKLDNLGSWTNRKYYGTYTLGDERGSFSLTLN